jgi:hypothetical protein
MAIMNIDFTNHKMLTVNAIFVLQNQKESVQNIRIWRMCLGTPQTFHNNQYNAAGKNP